MPRSRPTAPLPLAPAVRTLPLALALMASLAAGCGPLTRGRSESHPVSPPRDVSGITLTEVDSSGVTRPYGFRAAPGGVVLAYFGFASCPDVCPTTLAAVRQALALLGPAASRVELAFVTVDPARDSAAVLAPYVRSFVPRGRALRPSDQASLGRAERAFKAASSVTRVPGGEVRVSHTPYLYAVDARGGVVFEWGFGVTPARLAADLRALLGAKGAGS